MRNLVKVLAAMSFFLMLQGNAFAEESPPPEGGKPRGMIDKADTNKDGKVTYDEFKAAREVKMQEHFNKLDANGDGAVDKEEAHKAREMQREKRQERREHRRENRQD